MIAIDDITMCTSINCPERDNCYRAQAKADEQQIWCNFEYTCNENSGFCDFITMKQKSEA